MPIDERVDKLLRLIDDKAARDGDWCADWRAQYRRRFEALPSLEAVRLQVTLAALAEGKDLPRGFLAADPATGVVDLLPGRPNSGRYYYRDGLLHREDGPAVELESGEVRYYRGGLLHCADGPAVRRPDGSWSYYRDGLLHREDGPAVRRSDGTLVQYRDGRYVGPGAAPPGDSRRRR